MPSVSSCLLHVFCFAEYPYQTESKRDKIDGDFFPNIYDFWKEESTRDGAQGGHEAGGRAPRGQALPGPSWAPRKAVDALLLPQQSIL